MKKIFAANWKLNKSPEEAREFLIKFKNDAFAISDFFNKSEVIFFPSAFALEAVSSLAAGTQIGFGPQNFYHQSTGAFTGENSAAIAQGMGASYALIGHSERREIFKELDNELNLKLKLLQSLKITPVFCIGELLAHREAGKTLDVCFSQLEQGLKDADRNQRLIVAYEPVWAIGTGKVATTAQVAEVHRELHGYLQKNNFNNFQILYGGSVKPENSAELLKLPHVDGFLIGGAALQVGSFIQICNS